MGEPSAVEEILNDPYVFPEECPKEARDLCKQASLLYKKVADEVMQSTITKKIFQRWWRKANEDIQLSMSTVHFGYLKTAAGCN